MRNEIIEKLKDPDVAGGVIEAGSVEDVSRVLSGVQMEVTPDEASEILEGKNQLAVAAIGSLSDENLSEVAGGLNLLDIISTPAKKLGQAIHGEENTKDRETARQKVGGFISDHALATTGVAAAAAAGTVGAGVAIGIGVKKLINKRKNKRR